jgi:membrane protein YqaA with SNARE-associated domain
MLGVVALVLAFVATVGASILGAIASYRIGLGAGRELTTRTFDTDFDWSILTPVRDWVLLGEVSFWVGTALGVWALVQGIFAIVTARGRGAGIAAVIVAALGPIAFGAVVQGFLTAGLTAGTGMGS